MRYVIREKLWSWGDDLRICDGERELFRVRGPAFSSGERLSFQDSSGRELAFIGKRLWSRKPRYDVWRRGELSAEITKEFAWFHEKFTLDVSGPERYTIEGSFWRRGYEFRCGSRLAATVAKPFWTWTDAYRVEIADGEDDVAILCTAVVIHQVLRHGCGD